jgi:hypothetical protein
VLRPPAAPALHVRQRPGTDPRRLRELLQRQARRTPMTTQQLRETGLISNRGTFLGGGLPDHLGCMKT